MVQRELNLVLAWRTRNISFTLRNIKMEAQPSKQNASFCSATRENPFLHPSSKSSLTSGGRSGSMPPSRAWRRLLLVCFMLCTWEDQEVKEHQTLQAEDAVNHCQPSPGPRICRKQCHFPTKLFATHHLGSFRPHNHSVGRCCASLRPADQFFFVVVVVSFKAQKE